MVFVTNHVLSGVLIGRALEGRPVTAFVVGVGSHLVVDSIPHWGCNLKEPGGGDRFLRAARRDGLLGLATMGLATLAVDPKSRVSTVAAMAGAVVLDLDKPFQHFLGFDPFPGKVRALHKAVQRESEDGLRNEVTFGAVVALADAVVSAATRRARV